MAIKMSTPWGHLDQNVNIHTPWNEYVYDFIRVLLKGFLLCENDRASQSRIKVWK